MIKINLVLVLLCAGFLTCAQQSPAPSRFDKNLDLALSFASSQQLVAFAYNHNWRLGRQRKWIAGAGLRLTSYNGQHQDYITAPARLSRTSTTPFLVVFAGQQTGNWDTLQLNHPFTTSLNVSLNLGYQVASKWLAGLNIDLAGFSSGKTTEGTLTSNGNTSAEPKAKPSQFNVLLTGDNDYGNLNSEFFISYAISTKWKLRAIYQFYFSEYHSTNVKQIAPDGTTVTRFRNKVNAFGLGLSYQL